MRARAQEEDQKDRDPFGVVAGGISRGGKGIYVLVSFDLSCLKDQCEQIRLHQERPTL